MPATGDQAAKRTVGCRIWIGVHVLWIEPVREVEDIRLGNGTLAELEHAAFRIR